MEYLVIPLSILAFAVFIDAIQGFQGISSIIRNRKPKNCDKYILTKELLSEIDDLRDSLEYNCTEEEKITIIKKISDRQKIIDKL